MKLIDHVAAQIRELRTTYNSGEGMSQEALARQLNVAPNTVSRWETGLYLPSVSDLERLARIFGVSIVSFFPSDKVGGEDEALLSLLRTASQLHPEDLEELRRYAEFRKARRMYEGKSRPKAGRKRSRPK
ncbi:MAG TPA: helix-turn-helix transcriptional regulator [Pyrinomonadaceae bacterium]|nr:helix-turn-helix transcriptional regulator [Pyrinomonadaceae bacterium]